MDFHFKTKDCPDANGRVPQPGEQMWTMNFPLEGGDTLWVEMGKLGRDSILTMLKQEDEDNLKARRKDGNS